MLPLKAAAVAAGLAPRKKKDMNGAIIIAQRANPHELVIKLDKADP